MVLIVIRTCFHLVQQLSNEENTVYQKNEHLKPQTWASMLSFLKNLVQCIFQ